MVESWLVKPTGELSDSIQRIRSKENFPKELDNYIKSKLHRLETTDSIRRNTNLFISITEDFFKNPGSLYELFGLYNKMIFKSNLLDKCLQKYKPVLQDKFIDTLTRIDENSIESNDIIQMNVIVKNFINKTFFHLSHK